MSELREAAQADSKLRNQHKAFTHWFLGLHETTALAPEDMAWAAWKAALAQPETAATKEDLRIYDAIAANYAHPPRNEWRPASEPPDSTRSVLIWLRFGDVETFGKTLGGPHGFAFQNGAITHWRDVTPPMESPIAAKCQRIEGSGEICGLTPPCPDCGSSLIDVPEGSL